MVNLHDVLQENQLSINFSIGDGHCLLYSFVSSWNSQIHGADNLTLDLVIARSIHEFRSNFARYEPFLTESHELLLNQLHRYLSYRDYNQSIGDIYPAILSNAFEVDLYILDQRDEGCDDCSIVVVTSECKSIANPLFLHRINNNHYNGFNVNPLTPSAEANIRASVSQPIENGSSPEHQAEPIKKYTSEELHSLNKAGRVPRQTRKVLFRYRIWRPKSRAQTKPEDICQQGISRNPGKIGSQTTKYQASPNNTDRKEKQERQPLHNHLNVCTVNTQSIRNKTGDVVEHVTSQNIDICAITETWLQPADDAIRSECQVSGYIFRDCPRKGGRIGGGTGLLCRSELSPNMIKCDEKTSYEFSEWQVKGPTGPLLLVIIYRPPYSKQHPVSTNVFMDEFAEHLQELILCKETLLITGDFNIHMDDRLDSDAVKFNELLLEFGLNQHVSAPTHRDGHTLDLIITRGNDSVILTEPSADYFVSDHSFVVCTIDIQRPSSTTKTVTYRKFRNINIEEFKEDIKQSSLNDKMNGDCDDAASLEALASQYNKVMRDIVDKHAPEQTKTVRLKSPVPWFDGNLKDLKRQRRKAERQWLRHKADPTMSETYKKQYNQARNEYRAAIEKTKTEYYSDQVQKCAGDQKKLFALIRSISKPQEQEQYPDCSSLQNLANAFANFFAMKIANIRTKLEEYTIETEAIPTDAIPRENMLLAFQPLSEDDIRKLIIKSPNKQCDSDPIPTWLLKECLDPLLPVLTFLVNKSLQIGYFPEEWKNALVTPLLKKLGLELIYPNYRPVSGLPFVSKLTEKASVEQLTCHMNAEERYPSHQSAYRPFHSTETALLKVQSDILLNMDNQQVTLLVMLDLSAAFDTIDHSVLVETLRSRVGVDGVALQWFMSYLSNRTQQVKVNGVRSEKVALETGVPQGSCLGPVLFTVYVADLFRIIEKHLPDAHGYADDHQVYLSFRPGPSTVQTDSISAMENCISDLRSWMIANWLKVNDSKTEFMVIGSKQQLERVSIPGIQVGDETIAPVTSVRNLGAIFDSNLKMDMHIAKACKSAYYHLHNIRRIRKYLTDEAACTITHAFVTSQIDYCNSLMSGLPSRLIQRVQRVHNTAARVVCKLRKYDHITPALITLHWLPVKYRIDFKVLLLVFKGLHGMAPRYIEEMLSTRTSARYSMRSNEARMLTVPKHRHSTMGARAFAVYGPTQWNALPIEIRLCDDFDDFKRKLKTHLFVEFVSESM